MKSAHVKEVDEEEEYEKARDAMLQEDDSENMSVNSHLHPDPGQNEDDYMRLSNLIDYEDEGPVAEPKRELIVQSVESSPIDSGFSKDRCIF